MVPDGILFCLLEILSKDFEPDNRPVHFRLSGLFLLNYVGLKYKNSVLNRLFA